ncbi:MAG: GTP-binding protein [Burkholderiaceae bacterium]|nr:GTP-binding protein [Burkholderiaceae bacterium]
MVAIDRRALGLALSRAANASVDDILALPLTPAAAAGPRIGLTGPPGAGKSSLGGRLALLRARTRRIGMLAIDPTSPLTGGAILGDRIRIDELEGAEDLYVRSLASRSAADGLADNLPELLQVMERADFDEIVVETVGVGQAEHAARSLVDTLVLVLNPGSGDAVQAMKAGIMELADLYVINKADQAGAAQMAADIRRVLQTLPPPPGAWLPPVLMTSIHDAASIEALSAAIDRHLAWLRASGGDRARRIERARYRLRSLLERRVAETVAALPAEALVLPFTEQVNTALTRLATPPREAAAPPPPGDKP